MTVEKTICDECGRTKAEANHWFEIGVTYYAGKVWVELGDIQGPELNDPGIRYRVRDLCGEQCFHKHIAKLLGFNQPIVEGEA